MIMNTIIKDRMICKKLPSNFNEKFSKQCEKKIIKDTKSFLNKVNPNIVPMNINDSLIQSAKNDALKDIDNQFYKIDKQVQEIKSALNGAYLEIIQLIDRKNQEILTLQAKQQACSVHSKLSFLDNKYIKAFIIILCTVIDFLLSKISFRKIFRFESLVFMNKSYDDFYLNLMCITVAIGINMLPSLIAKTSGSKRTKFWDTTNKIYALLIALLFIGITAVRFLSAESFVDLRLVAENKEVLLRLSSALFFSLINATTSFICYNLSVYKETVESLQVEIDEKSHDLDRLIQTQVKLEDAIQFDHEDYVEKNKQIAISKVNNLFDVVLPKAVRQEIIKKQQ